MTEQPRAADGAERPPGERTANDAVRPLRILLVASMVVPLALFVYLAFETRQRLFDDATDDARASAAVLREHAQKVLETQELVIGEVAARLSGRTLDQLTEAQDLHMVLSGLVAELAQIRSIWVADRNGRIVLTSWAYPPPTVDIGDRPYFRLHQDAKLDTVVSEAYPGPETDVRAYNLSRRIPAPGDAFRGIIVVTASPAYFVDYYSDFTRQPGEAVTLVRDDGAVLASLPERDAAQARLQRGDPLLQAIRRWPAGVLLGVDGDGAERLVAYEKVGRYPVFVASSLTTASILSAWYRLLGFYGVPTALVAIALALTTLSALRRTRDSLVLHDMLRRTNDALERRVGERTLDLSAANSRLQDANAALQHAVAERELLLREIHHRVKNNLQVIISLLNLQASAAGPAFVEMFAESLRRIRTMARIHELIYSSDNVTGVDFGLYLEQLCGELPDFYGIADRVSCSVRAEHLRFDLDTATPLAMIINEVLANACKHAFPEGRGTIAIDLARRAGQVVMTIADDGVGMPSEAAATPRKSMGLRLVQTLSARLDATYRFEPGPGGRGTFFELSLADPGARHADRQ